MKFGRIFKKIIITDPEDKAEVKAWVSVLRRGGLDDREIDLLLSQQVEGFEAGYERLYELREMIRQRSLLITEEKRELAALTDNVLMYKDKESLISQLEEENEACKQERDEIIGNFKIYIHNLNTK